MVLKGFLPLLVHYNDDGCFIGRRHRASNETIHDFLRKNDIDVSLVLFQRNVVVDHDTVSTAGGKNVTDSSVDVSSGIIETITDTGEKIFQVNFKTKEAYTLHNSTSGAASEHDAVTRTSEIQYYARNPVIDIQTSLLRFMPWVTRNLAPSDHRESVEGLLNVTRIDYLYVTSYPVFEGYRIQHDPIMTAYFEAPRAPEKPSTPIPILPALLGLALIGAAVALILVRRS